MRARNAVATLLLATSACATAGRGPRPLPPLRGEGELLVHALPMPREAERLTFSVDAVSLLRADGTAVPLEAVGAPLGGASVRDQRAVASGRVPPGEYTALLIHAGNATMRVEDETARLLVDAEPFRAPLALRVTPGAATVVWLAIRPSDAVRGYAFTPAFSASLPPQTPPQIALYCTNGAAASVSVIDRRAALVTGAVPVGDGPRGIAVDWRAGRAFVALSNEDQLEIVDLASSTPVGRIRLVPGDGPTEVALAADGTLVVLNERSRTVSFVDAQAGTELGRVRVGEGPGWLQLDRTRRRAYVANRSASSITAIDIGNRAVFATAPTDPEPLQLAVSRDGTRLFVAHRGSAELGVFSLPGLALEQKAYVGLGVSAIRVDPRTELIYLARGDEGRISVYDPVSLQPIDQFDVPGAVSYMAIEDAENVLLAVIPEARTVVAIDLTSRRILARLPVGLAPSRVALIGERL